MPPASRRQPPNHNIWWGAPSSLQHMLCYRPLVFFVTKQPAGAGVSQLRAQGATASLEWIGGGLGAGLRGREARIGVQAAEPEVP